MYVYTSYYYVLCIHCYTEERIVVHLPSHPLVWAPDQEQAIELVYNTYIYMKNLKKNRFEIVINYDDNDIGISGTKKVLLNIIL